MSARCNPILPSPTEAGRPNWFLVYLVLPGLAGQPLDDFVRAVATEQPADKIREELLQLLVAAGHPDPAKDLDHAIRYFTKADQTMARPGGNRLTAQPRR